MINTDAALRKVYVDAKIVTTMGKRKVFSATNDGHPCDFDLTINQRPDECLEGVVWIKDADGRTMAMLLPDACLREIAEAVTIANRYAEAGRRS